jgi:protein SCO1/2
MKLAFALLLIVVAPLCRAQDAATNRQIYPARGVIKEIPADGRSLVIQHDPITNYMQAMTMPFDVKDTNELRGLQPGDTIGFQLVIAGADAWIEHLTNLDVAPALPQAPAGSGFHIIRDVDPLSVGESLPGYHFTNQFGNAITTKQFIGQAFAFTFFFTRCPYPTFCPLMSANFEATQQKLLALPNAPTNWQLISISFDTTNDTPAELKAYSRRYEVHPEHWNFVTGDLTEINAIGDQFGQYFGSDGSGGVTHNLRTVVIDSTGRVQKIYTDNKWTPDQLTDEILKACRAK